MGKAGMGLLIKCLNAHENCFNAFSKECCIHLFKIVSVSMIIRVVLNTKVNERNFFLVKVILIRLVSPIVMARSRIIVSKKELDPVNGFQILNFLFKIGITKSARSVEFVLLAAAHHVKINIQNNIFFLRINAVNKMC